MRVALNREATVRLRVDDDSGALVSPTATPTITVTDVNGSAVTPGSVSNVSTGLYASVLPPQAALTRLTVQWSYALSGHSRVERDVVSVVDRRLVPFWRIREDSELGGLSAVNMTRLADTVEDWLSVALGFPAAKEYDSDSVRVSRDSTTLRMPRAPFVSAVRAVTIDGTAQTVSDFTVEPNGSIRYKAGFRFGSLVEVKYEHGPSPEFVGGVSPADLERVAVILARYTNRSSNYPERARQVATEGALITFSAPAADRPTGLPEVDTLVSRYQLRTYL